jgi:hypothetical protein
MKQMNYKLIMSAIVVAGLFIGIVKGQEARSKWTSKMKSRYESRKIKTPADEVALDDHEIASFHRN